MASRKRAQNNENGSITEKLDKLADDIKALPKSRKEVLKDFIGKRAYSAKDAAKMLDISYSTIRRLMHAGVIKFFRINTRIRISSEEIERFANAVNLKEAAKILGVHPFTIWRMIKSGQLKASRIGRPYRISITDLEQIMKSESNITQEF